MSSREQGENTTPNNNSDQESNQHREDREQERENHPRDRDNNRTPVRRCARASIVGCGIAYRNNSSDEESTDRTERTSERGSLGSADVYRVRRLGDTRTRARERSLFERRNRANYHRFANGIRVPIVENTRARRALFAVSRRAYNPFDHYFFVEDAVTRDFAQRRNPRRNVRNQRVVEIRPGGRISGLRHYRYHYLLDTRNPVEAIPEEEIRRGYFLVAVPTVLVGERENIYTVVQVEDNGEEINNNFTSEAA